MAPAALVESDIYRKGEELMPWQRAFVALFLEHRETYGGVRLLLADEVASARPCRSPAPPWSPPCSGTGPS